MNKQKELSNALEIAKIAHGDQIRSFGPDMGKLHFDTHIIRVVESVMNEEAKPAAALHDVVEDTSVTSRELLDYTINDNPLLTLITVHAVQILTRQEEESYFGYIADICEAGGDVGFIARTVKFWDLLDNLRGAPPASLQSRYIKSISRISQALVEVDKI